MNYYFIDYENVHSNGFIGIENLGDNDFLHIMYTEQSKTFSFEILEKICKQNVKLDLHKVSTGTKDALDFQLSSYMGYIIAKNEERDCVYYVVSKDKGFNHIINFWKSRGVNVKRVVNFLLETELPNPVKPQKTAKPTDQTVIKPTQAQKNTEAKSDLSDAQIKKAKSQSKKTINKATKKELLECISEEEYSDKILEIINSYKSKVSIKNGFDKEFRDNQKSTALYKKLKAFLKAKGKT